MITASWLITSWLKPIFLNIISCHAISLPLIVMAKITYFWQLMTLCEANSCCNWVHVCGDFHNHVDVSTSSWSTTSWHPLRRWTTCFYMSCRSWFCLHSNSKEEQLCPTPGHMWGKFCRWTAGPPLCQPLRRTRFSGLTVGSFASSHIYPSR